jgi:hypothetical protein
MHVLQSVTAAGAAVDRSVCQVLDHADLVLVFGSGPAIADPAAWRAVRDQYPGAHVIGCSSAGEIHDTCVADDTLTVTAASFGHTRLEHRQVELGSAESSRHAGQSLARAFDANGLRHVFVLSDGTAVNGSELVRGLTENLPQGVSTSGGLSADGDRFQTTWVWGEKGPQRGCIQAIGFYGDRLHVGCASLGGWDPFGPERKVTKAKDNVLYELDGRNALELYREYLGPHAAGLPGTGLLFPLALRGENGAPPLVRTLLGIDGKAGSMTFAGDVPTGSIVRLMKANFDRLVDGAADAARAVGGVLDGGPPDLAVLISCVGRRMVLKQRVEEELEAVRRVLGPTPVLTGFYSYGEISPHVPTARCELHNQTMTITTLRELA